MQGKFCPLATRAVLVVALALAAAAGAAPAVRVVSAPRLLDLRVSNGSAPFAGDRRLLTTVSPNGDGFRDEAIVRFRLTRAATVRMDALATQMLSAGRTGTTTVWSETRTLPAGTGRLVWHPARSTQPRTYILRLTVGRRVYGAYRPGGAQNARVVRAGDWPSGLYFLRAISSDGRIGYAPFIVRPRRLGTHRVAVVLATNTWAAYNFEDADGDGWGDSWYVGGHSSVDLERPFLDFGVPFRFHDWDLDFVAWLNRTGKQVDFLSDDDLDGVPNGDELARKYDLLVFPGHEEYVTQHEYDVIRAYRDAGGNLLFLAANNLYRRVTHRETSLVRGPLFRNLGRPEASVAGVQYVGSNHGEKQGGFVVTGAAS